jgi:hypothetical protein
MELLEPELELLIVLLVLRIDDRSELAGVEVDALLTLGGRGGGLRPLDADPEAVVDDEGNVADADLGGGGGGADLD